MSKRKKAENIYGIILNYKGKNVNMHLTEIHGFSLLLCLSMIPFFPIVMSVYGQSSRNLKISLWTSNVMKRIVAPLTLFNFLVFAVAIGITLFLNWLLPNVDFSYIFAQIDTGYIQNGLEHLLRFHIHFRVWLHDDNLIANTHHSLLNRWESLKLHISDFYETSVRIRYSLEMWRNKMGINPVKMFFLRPFLLICGMLGFFLTLPGTMLMFIESGVPNDYLPYLWFGFSGAVGILTMLAVWLLLKWWIDTKSTQPTVRF